MFELAHDFPFLGPPAGDDLSDLAGGAAPPPAGLPALAPPLPAPLGAPPAGGPAEAAGAVSSADDLVLEEPSRAVPVAPPPIPPAAPAFEFGLSPDLAERGSADASGAAAPFEFGALGTDLSEPPAAEPVPGLEIAPAAWTVPGAAHFAGADPFAAPGAGEPFVAEGPAAEASASRVPTVTDQHLDTWYQFSRISGLAITRDDTLYAIDSESDDNYNPGWRKGLRVGSARTGEVWYFVPEHVSKQASGMGGYGSMGEASPWTGRATSTRVKSAPFRASRSSSRA